LHPKFVIIGANPSSYEGEQRRFIDVTDYINYHEKKFFEGASEEDWVKRWAKGYLEAYRILMNNPYAHLSDFNKNAIILNVIKCSTRIKLSNIPKWDKEEAKNNCIDYLIQQLENMQPPIVLSHGRFACDAVIGMLRDKTDYKVDVLSSRDLDTLSKLTMSDRSNHYALARNQQGHEALFLFNKHLSFFGSAMYRLKQNLGKKRTLVKRVICS
jgi:hypothetical protein